MVSKTEEKEWLRYLIPLPHEISIQDRIECHPRDISIQVSPDAGEIEKNAAAELERLFVEKADVKPAGQGFEILIGVADPQGKLGGHSVDVQRLNRLPNKEQAYVIQPRGSRGLLLAALDGRGGYYAVRTLYQLLESKISKDRVSIPLVTATDWPDMNERGMWNFPDPETWIPWMSSIKLNYGKMASTKLATVERGKPNRATINKDFMQKARLKAFNYLPYILHLNFLNDCGLFTAYPELAGVGDGALAGRYFAHKQGDQHRAPCASNPLLAEILAEWMADIASQDADEVSCWLSERPCQCGCVNCTAVGQFVLESRAFVAAWEEVRKHYPDLQIRIFLSTTTTVRNYRVLAELPPEVKIERACATGLERVTRIPRDLLANPLLDHDAAQGRWIASYDVPIGANGLVDTPEFKVPQSSAHRIRDFVGQLIRRNYSGAYGMMAWSSLGVETSGFNIHALAEWSWNLNGRSEKEFAVAWATRGSYEHPDAVGEWAELLGPVEFDVYDSDFPICYSWGKAIAMVQNKQRPYLGEGIFRYYTDDGAFDRKKAVCDQALEIAKGFENLDLANETRIVRSYVELARCVYQIAEQVATLDLTDPTVQDKLRESIADLEQAGEGNAATIKTWRSALGPEPWHHRVHDAIKATETTVREISRFVSERYLY